MSVNDLVVQGAEPLYFLDYFACSKLDVGVATKVVKGVVEGCKQAGCALIGGETAEMPGMYAPSTPFSLSESTMLSHPFSSQGDYDLAGFAVGVVERDSLLPTPNIRSGDVLLGLASSGLHSNGYSLVRKILQVSGHTYSSPCSWRPDVSLGQNLLEPTRIYVKQLLPACKHGLLKGLSHITGGGFIENIPRIFPKGLGCFVDVSAWELPPVFKFLMEQGNVAPLEMARTFNNGIGMVVVVDEAHIEEATKLLRESGDAAVYTIGRVVDGAGGEMRGFSTWPIQTFGNK